MIHELSESIRKRDDGDFLYPCYEENCISNIPGTVLDLFDVKTSLPKLPINIDNSGVDKVVLFILDGFGYNQFLRSYEKHKFLRTLTEKSDVYPLTSIFPSQTTNALTTLNTGLTPQQHGLFEYYIYIKEVGKIVNTQRFEPIGSYGGNELVKSGFDLRVLFNETNIQSMLKEEDIQSFTHIFSLYAYSNSSQMLFKDSTFVPSLKTSDLIVNLRKKLEKTTGPAYYFVHLSNLDTIAHEYGPNSYEYGAEVSAISYMINKELTKKIDNKTAKETLLLLTSDHGGVDIVPEHTTYLNGFAELLNNLKTGADSKPILPTGSARDVFLHVQDEKMDKTKDLLNKTVGTKAKIVETKQAIDDGLFGTGKPQKQFLDRAGNLLILPYLNETVWFDHFKEVNYTPRGQHGGLNKDEMLVPLAVTKLSNLN
ncbi:MAG: alkaline phosphatase family protein [Candidatus Bathyarchaeota archaeon]|nr:alkaline phosphatase family protein [Candidatus Bathyarchaeota archaeon]